MSEKIKIKEFVYISMLVGLSFIGSLVKIQGSIALDSMPGFFAAIYLGPLSGAIVISIGHLITAFISGFPQTLLIHLILVIGMGIVSYFFGWIYRKTNPLISSILAVLMNSIGLLLILSPITKILGMPLQGKTFFITLLFPLIIASSVNVFLANFLYVTLINYIERVL